MTVHDSRTFNSRGWAASLWILITTFQYGWHISVLNQIQAVLSCQAPGSKPDEVYHGLPTCIPMNNATYSSVTSIFCFGGLVGSLLADSAMEQWGRKGAIKASAVMFATGSAVMGFAPTLEFLLLGRLLIGVGAGGMSVAPLFIAEIAPPSLKGQVGVLNQFSIVIGLMLTQVMGLVFARPHTWRLVLLTSTVLSGIQLLLSSRMYESPVRLNALGNKAGAEQVAKRLWHGLPPREDDAEDPLLQGEDEPTDEPRPKESVSIITAIRSRELRRPLIAISLLFISQQISGVNAVLYYSNAILSKSLPDLGPYVSLGITVINVIMTVPPIFLIERIGRMRLLYSSTIGAVFMLVFCGVGLNTGAVGLSSVAILAFITSFAVGLGPVPFVLIPVIAPPHAASALSSFGLSTHWVANYFVGQTFLPLRDFLSGGDATKEGRVFFAFALALALSMGTFSRVHLRRDT